MKILYAHPTGDTGERACVAFVDVELNEHIRLYGLRLLHHPDGRHTLQAPNAGKRRSATFSQPLAERIAALAIEAVGAANER